MRKITDEEKRDVFNRWMNGDSYRKILKDKDIGTASISRSIDDVRKRSPDLDQLRKLNVRLKEKSFTVYDALRACLLLENLNNYGISLSELQQYINLSKNILSDKQLQDNVIIYAVKLMQLEQKYGRPYETVTEDFNKLVEDTEATKTENAKLKQKNKKLREEFESKAEKNRKLDAKLVKVSNELAKVTTAHKQLRDFGLEKLYRLANFARDIDALDISVEEVQKLTILKKELTSLGFDPDNIKKDAIRILSLSGKANELLTRVESLGKSVNQLLETRTTLLAAHRILQTNTIGIPCRNCGRTIDLVLPTKQDYHNVNLGGGFIPMKTCPHCGTPQLFSMLEIAAHVGLTLLP